MRALWSIVMTVATFAILVPLELIRLAIRRSRLETLRERLGHVPPLPSSPRRLLLHAVSAGEMNAASALVHEMAARGWTFVLSAGNDDARTIALRIASQHAEVERVVRAPWDRRTAQLRFLRTIGPSAVAVIETEIWPHLFAACRQLSIPLVIAGGRIDPRAARRYARLRSFFSTVLSSTDAIFVVDQDEAGRFCAAGADERKIAIAGNLKADACAHDPVPAFEHRRGIAAISTHPGEEELIVAAFESARRHDPLLRLTLVPRHIRRSGDLQRFASEAITIDARMGAVGERCRTARIVILGGTFAPFGGHDPLEPARNGAAIIAGPSTHHINRLVSGMLDADALIRTSADGLARVLASLTSDAPRLREIGSNAQAFAASCAGAARRHADAIEHLAASRQ